MYQPHFPPVPFRLGLYPVVDSVEWIARLLDAGVRTIQLRIKDKHDDEVEADVVAAHIKRLDDYPTVAIGGISLERAPAVLATGVGSIAVVSAITQAADWRDATAKLLALAGVGDE